MTTSTVVSVIMAARNVERYIDEAIQSVLDQRGVSFELLIGDDASVDGTWERILTYRTDPRVKGWRCRLHRGAGTVRNRLIARARGKYLSICDADDRMLPGNLGRLSAVLDRQPRVGVVFCGKLQRINQKGDVIYEKLYFPGPSQRWDLLDDSVPHPGTMIRTHLVRQVGGYKPDCIVAEDYDLFLRLAEVTKFKSLNGETLYLWRKRAGSLTCSTPIRVKERIVRQVRLNAVHRRYPKVGRKDSQIVSPVDVL